MRKLIERIGDALCRRRKDRVKDGMRIQWTERDSGYRYNGVVSLHDGAMVVYLDSVNIIPLDHIFDRREVSSWKILK